MLLSSLFVGIRKSDKEIPSLLYNVTPRDLCLDRKSPYSVFLPIYLWLLQFIRHQLRQSRRQRSQVSQGAQGLTHCIAVAKTINFGCLNSHM